MREARSQDGQPANSRGGRMPLLVSPDHAPIFLDLLFTLLTSNVSAGSYSKGFDLLKSLKQQVPALNTAGGEAMDTANASLDPSASVLNDSARTALGLAENGEAVDEYLEYSGRSKVNLTLLKLDLDLSPVFPSLEAVSADVQVFLIFVYSLAAVLSLVGNVTVILVLAFGRRSSVRCYLINLAVSDITMATFCIPFSYTSFMFHRWVFAPEFCRIAAFMQHASVTSSVYTLVAIGVDRYKALIHPLNTRWTKSRSRLVIAVIWVFSVVISLVPLVVSDSERFDWDGEWYYECKENWPKTQNELYEKTYTVVLFVLTFALPVLGLGYTYLSIVGMMCSYRIPGNAEPSRDQQHLHAKVKVINMMIAVMVCFVLSWFPLQVLQFLIYFAPEMTQCRGHECFTYYMSFFACHWIAMANSFMNPFIYCFMSNNFREDLCQFIRKCGRRRIRRQNSKTWSRSELGSSFRSILYITHKTSVQSSTKASFRGKTAKHRDADTLELRQLQDAQLPPRATREESPGVRSSRLSPPRPKFPAIHSKKGKLAVATLCVQEVPHSTCLNQHSHPQHLSCYRQASRHNIRHNYYTGLLGRHYKSPCGANNCGINQDPSLSNHCYSGLRESSNFLAAPSVDSEVASARTNTESEQCHTFGEESSGHLLKGCQSQRCIYDEEQDAGLRDLRNCPLTVENGVYEYIDLEGTKQLPRRQ